MSTPVISTFTDDYGTEHRVFHDAETGTQTEVWEYGSTSETVVSYRDGTLKWATSKNGRIAKISFYDAARVLHCVDGPAIIEYDESEHPRRIRYYQHGQLHRIDAPAETRYREDGSRESEAWYLCGQLDRDDGPAIVEYDQAGHRRRIRYYQHGQLHRVDGPAVINYDQNGHVRSKQWYRYGLLHREDGPAVINYDQAGNISYEGWFQHDKRIPPQVPLPPGQEVTVTLPENPGVEL
ncbi:hypothetical protein HHJ81_01640 [Mobiluncus mulieris]|uniref:toxin-antitoxin system YwqK family antitoxin n=1 Tax=Mobiluncus mulieris TaxID=2052 RepID=UPI00147022A7|nr:hypothetical protein [Mobiluncus mulieris]MCV0011227.1 hypothetical protein [Mobiluncus mulieris]NMW59813.1 hypothetical protein [Mobiluncus mulieris]NMW62540.1 hypothetical protein [Mobiluncus mulieris]